MKRTELKRLTPMKRTAMRRTPMKVVRVPLKRAPMKQARPRPAVPPAVRRALAKRSGGECEMRIAAAGCRGRATDPSHRVGSQAGGRHGAAKEHHDRLSNLVHACRACHRWCHENAEFAGWLGLILRQADVPEEAPVMRCGVRVLLDNEGGWSPCPT